MNRLTKIVSRYFTEFTEVETSEPKNYFRVDIPLPGGGRCVVGLENKTRFCPEFLHFNIRDSKIRLQDSNAHNGKINVFGNICVDKLNEYLKELQSIIKPLN